MLNIKTSAECTESERERERERARETDRETGRFSTGWSERIGVGRPVIFITDLFDLWLQCITAQSLLWSHGVLLLTVLLLLESGWVAPCAPRMHSSLWTGKLFVSNVPTGETSQVFSGREHNVITVSMSTFKIHFQRHCHDFAADWNYSQRLVNFRSEPAPSLPPHFEWTGNIWYHDSHRRDTQRVWNLYQDSVHPYSAYDQLLNKGLSFHEYHHCVIHMGSRGDVLIPKLFSQHHLLHLCSILWHTLDTML